MAEKSGKSGLAFILGAVVVVLAGVVWYISTGGEVPAADEPEIQIDLPDGG
ncbi:hypothetical protein PSM7751_01207 [Pseudooceanicola marinus]|uniref:Uncharacterized protein n=1 Tax=Pseudooceanicola marinus TaxID=396013 RepID=A0A1X6YRX4_9RHOB|nr:hypothetical protein [Pseudooceanicola marinus]MBY5971160.1 hypothetical protein [Ferrimonas balearica]MCA1334851.1 hypothetical protein [Pseudooceanicola marinus]SLN29525.1 hypothetical protein PSM7751_01207 [Pseudooceanicola marinus]